ncbi:exonuclease, partial [Escherichia coli]|nr:exonuclease [Escherichia coli]
GATEITKEEYVARKNGTYTGLPQNTNAAQNSEQPEPVKVNTVETNKKMETENLPDADKVLAASRGEFVEGISDPNDPKWVEGIQTRDSVYQNQQEMEQNDQKAEQNSPDAQQNGPEVQQSEPTAQQETEKSCNTCGRAGGGKCPDCGPVMGNTTYQETFDEENLAEKDSEKMESTAHSRKESAGDAQHGNSS